MNAYFFSYHTSPSPAPPQLMQKTAVALGAHLPGPHQPGQGHTLTSSTQDVRGLYGIGEGDAAKERAAVRRINDVNNAMGNSAATPPAVPRARPSTMGSKQPEPTAQTPLSAPATSPVAAVLSSPSHRPVPCLVLFSPQGPHPLAGLTTVTLAHPGSSAAVVPFREPLRTHRGSLKRISADNTAAFSAAEAAGLGAVPGYRVPSKVTRSRAVRDTHPPPSGIRCVYDRDTRSRLLHIAPGTEVDFSSCMRLPPVAMLPAPSRAAAAPTLYATTPVHTVVAVQFCVAAPSRSTCAQKQAGASQQPVPVSPIPPPGSFHIELLLRASSVSETTVQKTRKKAIDMGGSGRGGGYRIRFTNAGHSVQRHTHHTKIPLQCVRTAQWVQLFLDLEEILQSCREAGAVIPCGAHFRLQQLRIGSGGNAASTGGIFVRRIIAGHGLSLPHPTIDHVITADGVPGLVAVTELSIDGVQERGRDLNGERRRDTPTDSTTLPHHSAQRDNLWISPEALRLPAEAGETLCVFVRTGGEHILSESPALPSITEEPSPEEEVHALSRSGGAAATQAQRKASTSAADVDRGTIGRVATSIPDSTTHRLTLAPPEVTPKPLSPPPSEVLSPHHTQRWKPYQQQQQRQQSLIVDNTHQRHTRADIGAASFLKSEKQPSKVQHHTALELLRVHDHQQHTHSQSAHRVNGVEAVACAATPIDPLSPSFPSSASPLSPVGNSSVSASDDAEMFVVREVSDAEQLAPSTPPQYPANQLMTGKPPLRLTQPPPLVATKHMYPSLDRELIADNLARGQQQQQQQQRQRQHVEEDVATESGKYEVFYPRQTTDCLLSATTSLTMPTTATTPEASVLSAVSYSSAVELMEEMSERVRRIHSVLAGAEGEAAAAAAAFSSIAAQPLVRNPPSHQLVSSPTAQGIRFAVNLSGAAALPTSAPAPHAAEGAPTDPSPLHPSVSAPLTPADLMNAVLGGISRGATVCDLTSPNVLQNPPMVALGAAKADSAEVAFPTDCMDAASVAPGNANAVLELWSSQEMPLNAQVPIQRPATVATGRGALAERLREHQAALSTSSSTWAPPHVSDARSGAMSSPASATTSWTFHSAPLTPQTPSIRHFSSKTGAAQGEALSRGGPSCLSPTTCEGVLDKDLPQRPQYELQTADAGSVAVISPPWNASSSAATRAVVWRRPVPVLGPAPSRGRVTTQHTLQDEVRVTGTPLSKQAGAPEGKYADARRLTTWLPREQVCVTASGLKVPLTAAVLEQKGVPAQQECQQVSIRTTPVCAAAQAVPPPLSGRCPSTVSSFHMWLPSSSGLAMSTDRGRYPSTMTPPSGDGDRHGDPSLDSFSGGGGGGGVPPAPQLGVAELSRPTHLPTSHPFAGYVPRVTADATGSNFSAAVAEPAASPVVEDHHRHHPPPPPPPPQTQTPRFIASASTSDPAQHAAVSSNGARPAHSQLSDGIGAAEKRPSTMSSVPQHQQSKKARSAASGKKQTSRGNARQPLANGNAAVSDVPDAGGGASADVKKILRYAPAPAAALMQALGISNDVGNSTDNKGDTATTLLTSSLDCDPSRSMEVEVETNQGYIYTGKLVHIDDRYNVMLHEALVRRARMFDLERAVLREKLQREARLLASSLQDPAAGGVDAVQSASELMPRPHYIGAAYIRSNNVFLIRFIDAGVGSGATTASATSVSSACGKLRSGFVAMAAAIKAHLKREKMRNRAARRKRLEMKTMAGRGGLSGGNGRISK